MYRPCKYNEQVMVFDPEGERSIPRQVNCDVNPNTRNCKECGWNPKVEAKRKKKIRLQREKMQNVT